MPLNEVSFAISPYIARANKAIKFYQANKTKTLDTGLMLCIAGGPSEGWPLFESNENPPLPSLLTTQFTNPIGFKRYKSMEFVVSDTAGTISVGGFSWRKVAGANESELYENVLSERARWLYIEAELEPHELMGETYRQVGLISDTKINTVVVTNYTTRQLFMPHEIMRTGSDPNYIYSGVIEVYQNKFPLTRPTEFKETFSWVLEF